VRSRGEIFKAALEDAHRARADRQDGEPDGPLTPAQRARRYRARLRGEHVAERKPGPVSREDRLRAALIEAQGRIAELEAEVLELRTALRRRR
jgi:hypothetical protein